VVDKVSLGQVFLAVLGFFPLSIITPLLHIYSYLIWGMDSGPVRGPVPQRQSDPIATVTITSMSGRVTLILSFQMCSLLFVCLIGYDVKNRYNKFVVTKIIVLSYHARRSQSIFPLISLNIHHTGK
jgi:hypothetical protein